MSHQTCHKKRAYDSDLSARIAGQAYITSQKGLPQLWTYQCRACGRWHVTRNGELNKGKAAVTARDLYASEAA